MDNIYCANEDHIGVVTLNRPTAGHALTLPMIMTLQQQLQRWENDSHIHAVVLQAAPANVFCAGGDVRSLYESRHGGPEQLQFFWHEYRLNYHIHSFKKPYIALMNGATMGGGVGITLHGSHPIASEDFLFAMPETGIGLFPDVGGSYLLSRTPGAMGIYLGLTGHRLSASEANAAGLVKHIVSEADFSSLKQALQEADLSHDAFHQVDALLQGFAIPGTSPLMNQEAINAVFSGSSIELIIERLTALSDPWAQETRDLLLKKSPVSLKVTLAQLQKAKTMTMAQCIEMDYCLAGHFMRGQDFYEGVRALLIDKDKMPRWQPSTLQEVTASMVADYFECGQTQLPLL